MNEKAPSTLTLDEIEEIEKLTLRWVFQAILDFGMEAHEIFLKSPDRVKDIAEDITRELLDRLPGHNVQQRIYGTVDYKKARYIILPDQTVRQALFIDSKAEKENRSATIQMSQISMWVRQRRSGREINKKGFLPEISEYGGKHYLTTTSLVHFIYKGGWEHFSGIFLNSPLCVPRGYAVLPPCQRRIWEVFGLFKEVVLLKSLTPIGGKCRKVFRPSQR